MTVLAGLDIGGTKIDAVVMSPDGNVLVSERVATRTGGAAPVYESARFALEALSKQIGNQPFDAIGVGIPGMVDHRRGTVANAVNLGIGHDCLPLGEMLARDYGAPVQVENDLNTAAMGTYMKLYAEAPFDHLAYLAIGTGLAAGLVLNRQLHRGAMGMAGEIGHMPVGASDKLCTCGQTGCLETVVSGRGFESLRPPSVPADQLYQRAAEGDKAAVAAVETFADHIAVLIQLTAMAYDPTWIVVGGGVTSSGPLFFDSVIRGVRRLETASVLIGSLDIARRVVPSPPGPVGAFGAACVARDLASAKVRERVAS